jgi:hypothetical protein
MPISDRDGPPAVAFLDQLVGSLARAEPQPSALDLGALVQDFTDAVHNARAWARRRGIPSGCVPPEPSGTMTVERAVAFAAELSAALRWLDGHSKVPRSMREVVHGLRVAGSEALVELDLAVRAVDETLRNVLAVRDVAAEQCRVLREAALNGAGDRADRVLGALEQIAQTLGVIRQGLLDWAEFSSSPD